MKRLLTTIFALCLLQASRPAPARALLGFGTKKSTSTQDVSTQDKVAMPGMSQGGMDLSQPPRMAQEAADQGAQQGQAPAPSQQPPSGQPKDAAQGAAAPNPSPAPEGGIPTEVVIKGEAGGKGGIQKPPLNMQMDPFESIREALKPDQQLLLAESPMTVIWHRTHPEFLKNQRVIEPWRTTFSERPGLVFRPRDQLVEVLQRKVEDKEAKGFQWSLTIADEEGKVFQHYEGSREPPEEILWNGQNDQGEWLRAGHAYSPVYMFTDASGTPYTRVDKPIRFNGIVHQERDGVNLTLDTAAIFGRNKASLKLEGDGQGLLRSAADLIKRRYIGIPIKVEVYAASRELAETQALVIQQYLVKELMLLPQDIATEESATPFSDQRVEIVLLNR